MTLLQLFKSLLALSDDVYFRFAQVPNAGLGHIHASMAATLALRICTSCNTLRLGYTKINFRASLALRVFVLLRNYRRSFRAASSLAIISLCVASLVRSAFTTASGAPLTNFCTFASLKYQMLGSVISMQAWLRLSPYAFVIGELL